MHLCTCVFYVIILVRSLNVFQLVCMHWVSLEIKVWKFWQATPPPLQAHTLCRRKKNCHLDIHFRFNFFRWWNALLYRKYALLKIKHSIPRPVIIGVRPKGCWFVPRCGHLTRDAFLTQPWNFGATLSISMESLFDYHVWDG